MIAFQELKAVLKTSVVWEKKFLHRYEAHQFLHFFGVSSVHLPVRETFERILHLYSISAPLASVLTATCRNYLDNICIL